MGITTDPRRPVRNIVKVAARERLTLLPRAGVYLMNGSVALSVVTVGC